MHAILLFNIFKQLRRFHYSVWQSLNDLSLSWKINGKHICTQQEYLLQYALRMLHMHVILLFSCLMDQKTLTRASNAETRAVSDSHSQTDQSDTMSPSNSSAKQGVQHHVAGKSLSILMPIYSK